MSGIYQAKNSSTGKVGGLFYLCDTCYRDLEGRLAGTLIITIERIGDSNKSCERCTKKRRAEDIY